MDNEQKQAEEHGSLPTAVSEEEPDEARRKSSFEQLFSSSQEKRPQRPELQMSVILQSKAAQHCTNGNEAMGKSQYEKAVTCFSKAIALQPEQGQCLLDRGLLLEALEAFGKAAEEKPGRRAHEVRSLACLTAAGYHADCLKQVNDWMLSDGPTSDLYVLRARLLKLLNQTTQCYWDAKAALALNPRCPQAAALLLQLQEAGEEAQRKAVFRAVSGELPEALHMINVALRNRPRDARLYLFRGILHRRLKDFTAAIEDLVQAVELSEEEEEEVRGQAEAGEQKEESGSMEDEVRFQVVLTYNDFAVQCFSRGLYAEASLLLNKAVEEEKDQAGLYLNRGDCFFKQGEWCFALADYQQAEEMMRPDDPAVRLRLAVLHNTLGSLCFQDGCFQEAADMLSLAIQYDPAAGHYYESRSKAFRKLLNLEGARRDFICALILDPTNEELPPMLMNLFPGSSAADVLSSPSGQAVRAQLMDSIQACSSSSDQQRLSEDLLKMTLTNENTASRPEDPSVAGEELKITGKSLLKILLRILKGESKLIASVGLQTAHIK